MILTKEEDLFYVKLPIKVKAFQYFYPKAGEVESIVNHIFVDGIFTGKIIREGHQIYINTLEGKMLLKDGSWIVKGAKGELWSIQDDIFKETYEKVN